MTHFVIPSLPVQNIPDFKESLDRLEFDINGFLVKLTIIKFTDVALNLMARPFKNGLKGVIV